MTVTTDPKPILDSSFQRGLSAPEDISCADWADKHFVLSAESSNTSGQWKTTTVQKAILNSFGNDAIEKVDFYKPARFGGTKMLVAANAYFIAHKKRNVGFYQPTKSDSDSFVKTEIEPSIRDCEVWRELLIDDREGSTKNTQSLKQFKGAIAHYKGGHAANSFRRITIDVVEIDELDGFNSDIGGEGSATTLSWGRVRNAVHPKQIQISTPTIAGTSLIEKAALGAQDILKYHVECPECGALGPIEWGDKEKTHGFVWEGRDAKTVLHHGKCCGTGWGNDKLLDAIEAGHWQGEKGYSTKDGIEWFLDGEACDPPRHVAFLTWAAYSPFSSWEQIVNEYFDALADSKKLQAFHNTVLAVTWNAEGEMSVTKELVESMIPIADKDQLAQITAITAGIDVQHDRLEIQYLGHATDKSVYPLGYQIHYGDTAEDEVYSDMISEYLKFEFDNGEQILRPLVACMDSQGGRTEQVHKFLEFVRRRTSATIIGINGVAAMWQEIADAPKKSSVKGFGKKQFYNIGVNTLKRNVYDLLTRFDQPERAFRFVDGVELPHDYAAQITAESMVPKNVGTKVRMMFENPKQKRNEALDVTSYCLAAKAWAVKHGNGQLKRRFKDL